MKIYDAYKLAIETGMSKDLRPKKEVDRLLADSRKAFDSLPEDRKELFDRERLWNPYPDCRFSCGVEEAMEKEAECFMWGIDITPSEVLLADRLREKGRRIDAIVAHHPLGSSKTCFPEVMWLMTDMFHNMGVPINVAESLMKPRMAEVSRGMMGYNFNHAIDTAKILGFPVMNIHSAADNMVQDYLTRLFERTNPYTLDDIIDTLYTEPEFRESAKYIAPPRIVVGSGRDRCGRIMCKMTGGTSVPKEIYPKLAEAGVGTVVGMHFPDSHYDEARKCGINMVVSEHMCSDSLGVNLICDVWEKHGIDVIPCSGFMRHSRN